MMNKTMLDQAQHYLAHRRALGFQLRSEGRLVLDFARYADAGHHRGPLTKELIIRWACLPQHVTRAYWARRLKVIRLFARHLLLTEPRTQLPPRFLFGPDFRRQPPHLYSQTQIVQILRRAGRLSGQLRPHTYQTLIGLLVCTGLRISEALNLNSDDVNLEEGLVFVRKSKSGLSRIVPLHRTALAPLTAYVRRRQRLFASAQSFFVSEHGWRLVLGTVESNFLELRKGIAYGRRPPRLHDFRHTAASRVLQRWQRSKDGALHRIAILARFLGHTLVTDTYWYLTGFPQVLKQATRRFELHRHENS